MKILIIDDFHTDLIGGLENERFVVHYKPNITQKEILELPDDYNGLIVRSKIKIDQSLLNHFSTLKFIARGGAGMDGIDIDYCGKNNILLINAPEGNREAVAEHTLAFILAFQTKLIEANKAVFNGIWDRERYRGTELKEKTVGVIGYGNTGREVSKRLNAFGCKVIANDILPEKIVDSWVKAVSLEVLLTESDIITLHVPFTNSTHHLVNSHFISQIKSSSLLLNMSRGEILDTYNVLQMLSEKKFAGLCLDVIEGENSLSFPDMNEETKSLIFQLKDRLLITPHVGGWTTESYQKIAQVLLNKIVNLKKEGELC